MSHAMLPLEGLLRLRASADGLQTCHQRHQRRFVSAGRCPRPWSPKMVVKWCEPYLLTVRFEPQPGFVARGGARGDHPMAFGRANGLLFRCRRGLGVYMYALPYLYVGNCRKAPEPWLD